MKLSNLRQGMVCKLRHDESITIVNKGVFFRRIFGIHILEEKYNDDLTHKEHKYLDIMEITFGNEVVFKRNESRWFEPEYDEEYFYTTTYGGIASTINIQFAADIDVLNNTRVFKTREEAEKRLRQQQAALSVERWIAENDIEVDVCDTDITKYYIVYDIEDKELEVGYYNLYITTPKQFILSSEEKAEQLIEEREKELKIMLGVEE